MPFRETAKALGAATVVGTGKELGEELKRQREQEKKAHDEAATETAIANAAAEEGLTAAEKKAELIQKHNELLEKQKELVSSIADRDKSSLDELAARAAHLTGRDKLPRGINAINSVTPLMRSALRIRTLEDRAKQEEAYGNMGQSARLQSEADRLRSATPGLKYQDRFPTEKIETQLAAVNLNLATSGIIIKMIKHEP